MPEQTPCRVLVVEDEANVRVALERFLAGRGYAVTACEDGPAAVAALKEKEFEVAVVDFMLPGLTGLELLRKLRRIPHPPEFVMVTGGGTVDIAIEAVRLGAYHYIAKPYTLDEIEIVVRRAAEKHRFARENAWLQSVVARRQTPGAVPVLVAEGAAMKAVVTRLEALAQSADPVLLHGEMGTGLERMAAVLHEMSGRAGPFVSVHADAPVTEEVEAELFGSDGADMPRPGALEQAADGTVVISQVNTLSPSLQNRLLETLRTGRVARASGAWTPVRARVVALTTRDLSAAVQDGSFAPQLELLFANQRVTLPPLRDRPEDIPALAQSFLTVMAGRRTPRLAPDAVQALVEYSWPGNLRELRNVMERVALFSGGEPVTADQLALPQSPRGDPAT
jgi:DNA-binding NtrC family response regulator